MKPKDNELEKTSRRQFGKTIVTALVAVPVISSLSSCASTPQGPAPTPSSTPNPLASETKPNIRGGNHPPVIIDGGSLSFSSCVKLIQTELPPPEPRRWKHVEGKDPDLYPAVYGHAKLVQITSDFGVNYFGPEDVTGNSVEILIYIQKVLNDATPEHRDVTYEPIPANATAQFRFYDAPREGDSFTAWFTEKLDNPQPRYLDKVKLQKYTVNETGSKGFRIGRVDLFVNGEARFLSADSTIAVPAEGYRIIIDMLENPLKP